MQAVLWIIFAFLFGLQLWGLERVIYSTWTGSSYMVKETYKEFGLGGAAKSVIILFIGLFFNRYIILSLFRSGLVLLVWYIVSLLGWTKFILEPGYW
jgi:hypothetical protein